MFLLSKGLGMACFCSSDLSKLWHQFLCERNEDREDAHIATEKQEESGKNVISRVRSSKLNSKSKGEPIVDQKWQQWQQPEDQRHSHCHKPQW